MPDIATQAAARRWHAGSRLGGAAIALYRMRRAGCRFHRERGAPMCKEKSMRWRRSTITAIPLPPHQLARQRFNRFPEAPVTWHIEQLVDDLLQRRRINVTPERLRNFPDRVVGRRHAREIVLSGRDAGASVGSNAARFSARSVRALDRRFQPVRRTPQPTLRAVRGPRVVWRSPTARAIAGPSLERSWHRASSDCGSRIVPQLSTPGCGVCLRP